MTAPTTEQCRNRPGASEGPLPAIFDPSRMPSSNLSSGKSHFRDATRVSDVHDISRHALTRTFPWFDETDPIIVECVLEEVRLFYICRGRANSEERTFIDCRFHFDSRQLWIGSIQVASCYRSNGVGAQLVRATEAAARLLEMREIRLQPRPSAIGFWERLQYVADPRAVRVMWKDAGRFAAHQTRASQDVRG